MGTILSNIASIDNIHWTKLRKGRVQNAKRILLIREDGVAIVELENGSFTVIGKHHTPDGNHAVLGYGLDSFTQAVLYGLVKIGILKRKDVMEHIATQEQRKKQRERKDAIRRMRQLCDELGVEPPKVEENV